MKAKTTKLIALMLSLMLLFTLVGCTEEGSKDKEREENDNDVVDVLQDVTDPEEPTETEPVYEKQTVYLCVQERMHNYNEDGVFLKGYTYDEYGRVTEYFQIKDDGSRGWVNVYSYDENGNNTEINTGNGLYTMTYDDEGRMLSQVYAYKGEVGSETYYTYDENGYVIAEKRIERYSEEVTYTYEIDYNDDYSEAIISQYKNGEPNGTTYETYNLAGQVLTSQVYDTADNWKSGQTYSYDDAGNLLQQGSYSSSETQADYMTIYTYDEKGLLISKNVDYYYGYLLEYTYEPFEILVRVN